MLSTTTPAGSSSGAAARRVADEIDDVVLLLEHPSVYTAGKRTEPQDRPVDGTPVVEVDRGGKITWHGPGQLVGYPIAKLPGHVYVVDYVRRLEEALIRRLRRLRARRPDGSRAAAASGSLPTRLRPERKVAALGVRVSQGVTMHGLALNCDNTMDGFRRDRAVWHRRRCGDDAVRRGRPDGHGRGSSPERRAAPARTAGVGAVRALPRPPRRDPSASRPEVQLGLQPI